MGGKRSFMSLLLLLLSSLYSCSGLISSYFLSLCAPTSLNVLEFHLLTAVIFHSGTKHMLFLLFLCLNPAHSYEQRVVFALRRRTWPDNTNHFMWCLFSFLIRAVSSTLKTEALANCSFMVNKRIFLSWFIQNKRDSSVIFLWGPDKSIKHVLLIFVTAYMWIRRGRTEIRMSEGYKAEDTYE